ncbi:MAG: CocE/NonD family hydrolase [Acidobacteria bacterium]|nr:CocE/NonD family hydrolase [Acidobacteriota bacterium]
MGAVLIWVACMAVYAQETADARANYISDNYDKREVRIPMRDGVRLFTSIYTPKDTTKQVPILMVRTPYRVAPYGEELKDRLGPSEAYEKAGYIFVFQDVRGRFMSEGQFVNMRPHLDQKVNERDVDESSDTYDTIQWLVDHLDQDNGHVGMWGISYPGFYASAGMIDSHPALKAVSPQACIADWFWDDMHHHGALTLNLSFGFFASFGVKRPELTTEWPPRFDFGTPDGYDFFLELGPNQNANNDHFKGEIDFWNQLMAHPNYDSFWQSRNILPHLKNISSAVLIVGGWFDAEDLYGPLKTYAQVEKNNSNIVNTLVMGPWRHGGWHRGDGAALGDARFGEPTSPQFEAMEFQWFEHHLRGTDAPSVPEAWVFETGVNRWHAFDKWPPDKVTQGYMYLQGDGGLGFSPPEGAATQKRTYLSDPAKPVPYTKKLSTRWEATYMTEDQRFASQRPDVLVYESDILSESLTIAGPMQVELFVSTDKSDADFVVKIIDVYPDMLEGVDPTSEDWERGGLQQMVRGEIFRARYRNGYEHPEALTPNQPTRVAFELLDIFHTFKEGHRIMVHIQSSWFPLFDRNPQTYVENINQAVQSDFTPAWHTIYHDGDRASRIGVKTLK